LLIPTTGSLLKLALTARWRRDTASPEDFADRKVLRVYRETPVLLDRKVLRVYRETPVLPDHRDLRDLKVTQA
jgi:hypothetical protein